MESSYVTLTRQSGLMQEMRVIANNIANSATTGFRQEGFSSRNMWPEPATGRLCLWRLAMCATLRWSRAR